MATDWVPKPGDVVYASDFEIEPDDAELLVPESYRSLARLVVQMSDGRLMVVPLDGNDLAMEFRADRFRPTLAGAMRVQAESDIEYHEAHLAAARSVLALADRMETAGGEG